MLYILGAEGKDIFHEVAFEEMMERMRDVIIYELFGKTQGQNFGANCGRIE